MTEDNKPKTDKKTFIKIMINILILIIIIIRFNSIKQEQLDYNERLTNYESMSNRIEELEQRVYVLEQNSK